MKNLDTQTVMEIIKMIQNRMDNICKNAPVAEHEDGLWFVDDHDQGQINALGELHDHLQGYIEGLVNQVENKMGDE